LSFEGVAPGTVVVIDPNDLRTSRASARCTTSTCYGAGARPALGLRMPSVVKVFGVEVEDCLTVGEELSPSVRVGLTRLVEQVLAELG